MAHQINKKKYNETFSKIDLFSIGKKKNIIYLNNAISFPKFC